MLFGISLTFSLLFDTSINSLHSKIKNPSEQGQPLLYAHTLHITMQSSDFHQSGSLRDPIDNSCVRSSPRRSAPSACHIFIQGEEKLLFRQLLFPNSYLCIRFTNQTLTVITAFSTSPQEKGGIASLCMHVQTRLQHDHISGGVGWPKHQSKFCNYAWKPNSSLWISHLRGHIEEEESRT